MELDGVPVTADELAALALTNYGHFTSMRLDGGRVRGLDLHLDRLVRDCRRLFGVDLDVARVRALARRAAEKAPTSAMLRITVFDPGHDVGHPAATRPGVLVTSRSAADGRLPAVRLRTVRYQRDLSEVKHTGLFGAMYQRRAAQLDGYDDALFVGPDGLVTEGPTWNIGFVTDGQVRWPAADHLSGVTMRLLTSAMERAGITVRRAPIAIDQLTGPYAAFITNAGIGVRAVRGIDDVALSDGAAFVQRLRREYEAIDGQPL